MRKVKVYINKNGRRELTKALVIKENALTMIVKLKDGKTIKRHKTRDMIKEGSNG